MPDLDDAAIKETLLGNAVFAGYDGYQLTLRTPREHGDHYVILEPLVFRAFLEYARQRGVWTPK
jgi:hypothetical protein